VIQALKRPSARLRLTALYGVLFLVAGAMLLGLTYLLVRQTLPSPRSGLSLITANGTTEQPFLSQFPGADATTVQIFGQAQQQVLGTFLLESGVALVLMAMISVLLGWIVAGRVLAPVHQITATARRLSQANLHERIALAGPDDEIKELADTFDGMLARLDVAFESQQRFVANASHELRTPLTTQRALVDVNLADPHASPAQLRATLEKIRTVTDESEHLVMSLLALAKSERGLEHRTSVDLAALAQGVVEQGGGLHIKTSLQPAVVAGDPALLQRMVGNLVDNATRYNLDHGWILMATGVSDGHAFFRVSNSGRKIPDHSVSLLFEPFRRLDGDRLSDRGGAGLGLSIVRAIATAHGGQASATPLDEGGLTVLVTLPSAEDSHFPSPARVGEPGPSAHASGASVPGERLRR
jgi:signal transduction histidine kinase